MFCANIKHFKRNANKIQSFYNIKIFLSGRCYSVQAIWGSLHGQTGHRQSRKRSRARAKYEGHARASEDINKDNKNIK